MRASEPVAMTIFFDLTSVVVWSDEPSPALPLSSAVTATVKTLSFAGPVRRPCPRTTVILFLLHQKVETLGVLGDDLVLAPKQVLPVELRLVDAVNTVLACMLQVVPGSRPRTASPWSECSPSGGMCRRAGPSFRSEQPSDRTAPREWRTCNPRDRRPRLPNRKSSLPREYSVSRHMCANQIILRFASSKEIRPGRVLLSGRSR